MIPICLSPGDPSASRDQKGIRLRSIPPFQEMSVPHCPTAITSCEPGSPGQRPASFLPTGVSAEKEIQHIFMRLSGISCFIIMKERIVCGLAESKHVTPGNGLVLLLSCLRGRSVFFWQEGRHMMMTMLLLRNTAGQFGISGGREATCCACKDPA